MYIDKYTMHVLYIVIFVFVNCVCVMGRRPYITNKLTYLLTNQKGGSVGDSGAKSEPKPSQVREKDTKEDKKVKKKCIQSGI